MHGRIEAIVKGGLFKDKLMEIVTDGTPRGTIITIGGKVPEGVLFQAIRLEISVERPLTEIVVSYVSAPTKEEMGKNGQ